jgi:hypothetical protein
MRFLILSLIAAVFSLTPASASLLQFSAIATTGEIASFRLDTTVPNTYNPILYPNSPIRGVYLNAVYDLTFEGTDIPVADITTTPGETGDGRPLTTMDVGPLFNNESLSLSLIFLDPTLVTPLNSDPFAYEGSFESFQSVAFPQTPPPRTHVDSLLTLTVSEVPEPSFSVVIAMIALCALATRMYRPRAALHANSSGQASRLDHSNGISE